MIHCPVLLTDDFNVVRPTDHDSTTRSSGFSLKRLSERDTVSFLSLKGRAAQAMLGLADHFGQEVGPGRIVIHQKIGQNDLAAMAGIVRKNVTRVLNESRPCRTRLVGVANRAHPTV